MLGLLKKTKKCQNIEVFKILKDSNFKQKNAINMKFFT